jgi:hypothetical protein
MVRTPQVSAIPNWKVCLEIGLNHLGSYSKLEEIVIEIGRQKLGVAITVQIREESFYDSKKEFKLTNNEYRKFLTLCREFRIPCGLALGPILDLDEMKSDGLDPDFIKTLSVSSADKQFMTRMMKTFKCPKYISIGLSTLDYIENHIIPIMSNNDKLIHTCLSHSGKDQNLSDIVALNNLGVTTGYGLHSTEHNIMSTAIGAGADNIFFYIGDKSVDLPDFVHAIDLPDIGRVINTINVCFDAMGKSDSGLKITKIDFMDFYDK